jgi:predicted RNA binding protein YcfA (HicA-like mRNA interferase family)
MSSKTPVVSAREVMKILEQFGYEFDHQRGSHIVFRQTNKPFRRVTIPNHKEIARGTLREIIRQVGITIEECNNLR